MVNNPIPIILVLAAISRRGALPLPPPGALNTLELEAFLDNARTCINTIDKLNGIAHSGLGNLGNLSNLGSLSSLADLAADVGSSGGGDYGGGRGSGGNDGRGQWRKRRRRRKRRRQGPSRYEKNHGNR